MYSENCGFFTSKFANSKVGQSTIINTAPFLAGPIQSVGEIILPSSVVTDHIVIGIV